MNHDPLCGLSEPCDDEVAEHGYCSMQRGNYCIHCNQWCVCERIGRARSEERANVVALAMQGGIPLNGEDHAAALAAEAAEVREVIARSIETPEDDCWLCGRSWKTQPCGCAPELKSIAEFIRNSES